MEKLLKEKIIRDNLSPFISDRHIDKFLNLLRYDNSCIVYMGAKDGCGYGRHSTYMCCKRRTFSAHRLSYQMFVGKIPDGMLVLHSCDNPPCVNPKHLSIGTNKDNSHDKMRKGRGRGLSGCGENNPNSKFTMESVKTARHLYFAERRTIAEIAKFYGVTWHSADRAIRGVTWDKNKWNTQSDRTTGND